MQTPIRQVRRRQPIDGAKGLIAVFVTAAGIVILLSVIPVPRVSMVLKVVADDVTAVFDDHWEVNDLPLSTVSLTGLQTLRLSGAMDTSSTGRPSAHRPVDLVLRARPNVSNWSVSLAGEGLRLNLDVPARTDVSISFRKAGAASLQLTAECHSICGTLDTGESIVLRCSTCLVEDRSTHTLLDGESSSISLLLSRRQLDLQGGAGPIMIKAPLKPDGEAIPDLAGGTRLGVQEIGFLRKTSGMPTSSTSGTGAIAFTSLESSALAIAPGDFVYVTPAKALSVRRIRVNNGVEVELEGVVMDLSTGAGGLVRSRKPSILAFLYGSKQVQLIVGAVLALAGALSATLYRLGYLSKPV